MVLAHLRDKLEPTYPQGILSILRERLILYAIDCEVRAEKGIQRLLIEAAWSSAYTPQGAGRIWEATQKSWQRYYHMSEYLLQAPATTVALSQQGEAMTKVYEALEKAGVFAQIKERDKNLEAELTDALS